MGPGSPRSPMAPPFLRRGLLGYAGQFGWKYGIAATWAGIGNALLGSLLAWVVLGRRTRIMSQHLTAPPCRSFSASGSEAPLKVAASVIIFIFLIPYTASLYNGCPGCLAWPLTSTIRCASL